MKKLIIKYIPKNSSITISFASCLFNDFEYIFIHITAINKYKQKNKMINSFLVNNIM